MFKDFFNRPTRKEFKELHDKLHDLAGRVHLSEVHLKVLDGTTKTIREDLTAQKLTRSLDQAKASSDDISLSDAQQRELQRRKPLSPYPNANIASIGMALMRVELEKTFGDYKKYTGGKK